MPRVGTSLSVISRCASSTARSSGVNGNTRPSRFLDCPGWSFRCTACGLDRLVAFSCKGRGFCPRCGGRRMAERSAHLIDQVFPDVPVRQWVLSLPHRLRYLRAWDHELCRAVTGVAVQTVLGFLRVAPDVT